MTKTQERVEYLGACLKKGMSRPEAAKALSKHDKRVSRGYAVTLVYQVFSGTEYAVRKLPTAKAKATSTKKAPVKKVITKTKPKAPVKKAVAKKPAAKRPVAKKPAAKRPAAKKAAKPAPKKAPAKEKSFKEKAIDEVKQSTKTSAKKKIDKGDTPETRTAVKSKKQAPVKKKTSTPVSRKKKVTEGTELVF